MPRCQLHLEIGAGRGARDRRLPAGRRAHPERLALHCVARRLLRLADLAGREDGARTGGFEIEQALAQRPDESKQATNRQQEGS